MLNFPVPNKSLSGFQNFPSPSKLRWGFPDFRSAVIKKVVSALWTPEEIITALWLDADDSNTITLDGSSKVEQWDDKSGNNNHAAQDTASLRPALSVNSIDFSTGNHFLNVASMGAEQPTSFFVVAKTSSTATRQYLFDGSGTNETRNLLATNNSGTVQMWAGAWVDSGVAKPTSDMQISAIYNGESSEIYTDGGLRASGNAGAYNLSGGLVVGVNYQKSVDWFGGDVKEIIAINSEPSQSERQKIEGYLAWKWGIEANLPSDHPYKSAAPLIE